MAWYINVWESGTKRHFMLVDSVTEESVRKLGAELAAARDDDVVVIPERMKDQLRESPRYVRPSKWDEWQFFHYEAGTVE